MKRITMSGSIFASILGLAIPLSFSASEAKVLKAACSPTKKINATILKAKPGDTVAVSGVCTENILVPAHISGITIDGQGTATINAAGRAFRRTSFG